MQFIVLSSSRGTTFQAVVDALRDGTLSAECLGLVSDREDRGCVQKARDAGLPVGIVAAIPKPDREVFDRALHDTLVRLAEAAGANPHDVLLAEMGWMWIHTPWFIEQWHNRILNVHPALLPKFGGKGMYGHHVHDAVLASGDTESGVTFHLMDTGVDTGRIIEQKTCSILPDDTAETLQARVQELEKEWYPRVLGGIEEGRLRLSSDEEK